MHTPPQWAKALKQGATQRGEALEPAASHAGSALDAWMRLKALEALGAPAACAAKLTPEVAHPSWQTLQGFQSGVIFTFLWLQGQGRQRQAVLWGTDPPSALSPTLKPI